MKNQFKLIQMTFDGDFVTDSIHDTIEDAEQTSNNLGSKWFFYPFSIIVKGATVVECGGSICYMSTGEACLNRKFKGKRFATVQKTFKRVSQLEDAQNVDTNVFEELLINA